MSKPIITIGNLSKSYLVGHQSGSHEQYTALRDVVGRNFKNFARKGLDMIRGRPIVQGDDIEEFWALKNVSFEVDEGEVIGIVGKNGAGKSTLLKILSRITEPTSGRVTLRGRVASLLEVGTGFHPELTGRENIFLNGAILGMSRSEIKRKFDEIVDFAGVEKFLDTPVKKYSSGMYVRLAFSVAAHLEPEVLIVDEVLAVGDIDFQTKCLGKMRDVAHGGRTVLFVSHNFAAVRSLCTKACLLVNGFVSRIGEVNEVLRAITVPEEITCSNYTFDGMECSDPRIESAASFSVGSAEPEFACSLDLQKPIGIRFVIQPRKVKDLVLCVHIYNQDNVEVIHTSSEFCNLPSENIEGEKYALTLEIPKSVLNIGTYRVELALAKRNNTEFVRIESALQITLFDSMPTANGTNHSDWHGVVSPKFTKWVKN